MQSNNPILTRAETYADYEQPMTVQGAIQKISFIDCYCGHTRCWNFFL